MTIYLINRYRRKAYLLGFLSADGYILKDGKTIGIALKSEDKYMLEKFKEILQYEGKYMTINVQLVMVIQNIQN